ncbi:MAG: adenylate/guanylate cyclase domain-containing protein [Candidatus Dormibacteria bacterium]
MSQWPPPPPDMPTTRYTRSAETSIAYQVVGEGQRDLVLVPGWLSHLEMAWSTPVADGIRRLARHSRVIVFDKRGTGLSDRVFPGNVPTLENRMDDIRAVMDAAGSSRATVFGISDGGALAALYAAMHPSRVERLVTYGAVVVGQRKPDFEFAPDHSDEEFELILDYLQQYWPESADYRGAAPSVAANPAFRERMAALFRAAASPSSATTILRMNRTVDVRPFLPAVSAPTLVMHRTGDLWVSVEHSRLMARLIPGARLVEFPGIDHMLAFGDYPAVFDEVEEFVTGRSPEPGIERILTTVLFTDLVNSTDTAAALGDHEWKGLLQRHFAACRAEIAAHRGREVKTLGDGIMASFDGPARAVRCAQAMMRSSRELGLTLRVGVHSGECEVQGDDLLGIAVNTAARVAALAGPGEVLVSSTVRDLVAGSGLEFSDRGAHELRGIPGSWQVFLAG